MSYLKASISQVDGSLQEWIVAIQDAPSLGALMWAAWRLARVLAVKLVEEELMERAQRPTEWPKCKKCGAQLRSKGFVERYLTGLIGTVRWERRVGRCPHRCKIGQVAPLDTELGLQPNQRMSAGLQRAACALAVFVPFEVAAVLLSLLTQVVISPVAIWNWGQDAGQEAMARLQRQLEALQGGEMPEPEEMEATTASLPLLIGADGVMVPFRPHGGQPNGRTVWREVKVGILVRLRWRMTRTGFDDLTQALAWIAGIQEILNLALPTVTEPGPGSAAVARQLAHYLGQLADRDDLRPWLAQFRQDLWALSERYWSGLFHCYDIIGLPATNNAHESVYGQAKRQLRRQRGNHELREPLLRYGAWTLLPLEGDSPAALRERLARVSKEEYTAERARYERRQEQFRQRYRWRHHRDAQLRQRVTAWTTAISGC